MAYSCLVIYQETSSFGQSNFNCATPSGFFTCFQVCVPALHIIGYEMKCHVFIFEAYIMFCADAISQNFRYTCMLLLIVGKLYLAR